MRNRHFTVWLLSFIPIIIAFMVLPLLPDRIPAHFDFGGDVDRYGSRLLKQDEGGIIQ